jgi:hypothetical protein
MIAPIAPRGLRPASETDRPYPQRTDRLARNLSDVTPQWMTTLLQNRYPGIVVNDFERIELLSTHTTKLRLRLDLNAVGLAAGIPLASKPATFARWKRVFTM